MLTLDPEFAPSARRNVVRSKGSALLLGVLIACMICELSAQFYFMLLQRKWAEVKRQPNHLFQASSNDTVSFELKRNYEFYDGKRRVTLNDQGIRDRGLIPPTGRWKIAFAGDSVTFGQGLDQNEIFTEILQAELEDAKLPAKVLNYGVPGYDASAIAELVRIKDTHYQANTLYYLLNLNDFARPGTRFAGADNGLSWMYRPPTLKTAALVEKAIYRAHKRGNTDVHPEWYRWLVDGNLDWLASQVETMAAHTRGRGQHFTVLIYPAGCAYIDGKYSLRDLHSTIISAMKTRGIPVIDLADSFGAQPAKWFNSTDHLTAEGNRHLAAVLKAIVISEFPTHQ